MELLKQFTHYLASQNPLLSKTTQKNYGKDVSSFTRWIEKYTKTTFTPTIMTHAMIEAYKQDLSLSPASVARKLSSLRKFFRFLQEAGYIQTNPLDTVKKLNSREEEPWKPTDFANYLDSYSASELTIKYYLQDVKQFWKWLNNTKKEETITENLIDEYKKYLLKCPSYAETTVKRKFSALKKYAEWLQV